MAEGVPLPPNAPRLPGVPPLPSLPKPPGIPAAPSIPAPKPLIPPPGAGVKKETMRLAPPPKPAVPGIPGVPTSPKPAIPAIPGLPGKPTAAPAAPAVPGLAKPPADLRKETMRISLPPRPGGGGAKPAGISGAAPLPASVNPPGSGVATSASKPALLASKPSAAPSMTAGGAKPAAAGPGAVRTVVDTDSAGTALAIAALVASLISFGVVLLSFLQK